MKRLVLITVVTLAFAVAVPGLTVAKENGPVEKLQRGVINAAFGWVEIFSGLKKGGVEGFVGGIGKTIQREFVGVIETGLFLFPIPNENYEPILEPESPFDDF